MPNLKSLAFHAFHHANQPLVLNNVWDAASTAITSDIGAQAVATSSAAMAWSLGYADGSCLPTDTLISAVTRIMGATTLPVSVDIEDGYSDKPKEVSNLVKRLAELGVAGINIEDGASAPTLLVEKIVAIRNSVGKELFINARTDTFLQQLVPSADMLNTTIERMHTYRNAGANGGFVPGLLDSEKWRVLISASDMPMNAMIPSLEYDLRELWSAGVRRFSTGPYPFINAYSAFGTDAKTFSFDELNCLFKSAAYKE